MDKLGLVDLQILHLGIKKNGRFDEKDLENSEIKKLGVGRILDHLASLKEKKLIDMNSDDSFSITQNARHILWDSSIPLWIRILKVLEIKSQPIDQISLFLEIPEQQIENELEQLRKQQLVLMSPLREERGLIKFYEILPEGLEELEKAQKKESKIKLKKTKPEEEIFGIITDIIREIKAIQEIPDGKKHALMSKLSQVKEKLEKNSF